MREPAWWVSRNSDGACGVGAIAVGDVVVPCCIMCCRAIIIGTTTSIAEVLVLLLFRVD